MEVSEEVNLKLGNDFIVLMKVERIFLAKTKSLKKRKGEGNYLSSLYFLLNF